MAALLNSHEMLARGSANIVQVKVALPSSCALREVGGDRTVGEAVCVCVCVCVCVRQ